MVNMKSKSKMVGGAKGNMAFKRRKGKLGKKVANSTNETKNINVDARKIVIAEQSVCVEHGEDTALSRRGLSLDELLRRARHHNAVQRAGALEETVELLSGGGEARAALRRNRLGAVLPVALEMLSDGEADVRKQARALLGLLLQVRE